MSVDHHFNEAAAAVAAVLEEPAEAEPEAASVYLPCKTWATVSNIFILKKAVESIQIKVRNGVEVCVKAGIDTFTEMCGEVGYTKSWNDEDTPFMILVNSGLNARAEITVRYDGRNQLLREGDMVELDLRPEFVGPSVARVSRVYDGRRAYGVTDLLGGSERLVGAQHVTGISRFFATFVTHEVHVCLNKWVPCTFFLHGVVASTKPLAEIESSQRGHERVVVRQSKHQSKQDKKTSGMPWTPTTGVSLDAVSLKVEDLEAAGLPGTYVVIVFKFLDGTKMPVLAWFDSPVVVSVKTVTTVGSLSISTTQPVVYGSRAILEKIYKHFSFSPQLVLTSAGNANMAVLLWPRKANVVFPFGGGQQDNHSDDHDMDGESDEDDDLDDSDDLDDEDDESDDLDDSDDDGEIDGEIDGVSYYGTPHNNLVLAVNADGLRCALLRRAKADPTNVVYEYMALKENGTWYEARGVYALIQPHRRGWQPGHY